MSKKPGTKLAKKEENPHAVSPPDGADKPVEGNSALQQAAPVPLPHPASVPELWADLEITMKKLVGHFNSQPEALDIGPLTTVMAACLYMLKKSTTLGDGRAIASCICLFEATHQGCARLAETLADEMSRDVLRTFASKKPEWPVMLSLKKSSHAKANDYLRALSVGTSSNPPTAQTKIESDNPWTQRASMLKDKIEVSRIFLSVEARDEKSTSRLQQVIIERQLVEAREWPEVMKLPPEFNKKTRVQYWSVAKKMLKKFWDENPDQAKNDFKKVEASAKKSLEKSGEITGKVSEEKSRAKLRAKTRVLAIHSVREAFSAIAATQEV